MVLYNITVNVENSIEQDWLSWMRTKHIPDTLATGHFKSHKVLKLLSHQQEGVSYAIQYYAKSINQIHEFQINHGERLQGDMYARYGDKAVSFRTLLEEIE